MDDKNLAAAAHSDQGKIVSFYYRNISWQTVVYAEFHL